MNKITNNNIEGRLKRIFRANAAQFSMLFALIVLAVALTFASPYFLTWGNMKNLAVAMSVSGVMAAGLTVAMLMGGLDVSQWSILAFCMMVLGIMHEANIPVYITLIVTVVVSMAAGCINAFIITKMKINPIIATIGTQLMFRAGAFLITDGAYVQIGDPTLRAIGFNSFLYIPISFWVMILVYGLLFYILQHTPFGRRVYAVGGNPTASYLSGISLNKTKFGAYVISSSVAGIGAILLASQVSMALPLAGQGREMDGIAMVILGGVSLTGGKGKVLGTLLGVLVITVLSNGMTLLSVSAYYQMFIKGLVLILAVYVDSVRNEKR